MLRDFEFESYLASRSLSSEASLLMRRMRERGAAMEVAPRGPGSSIVRIPSRKMRCAISARSRTLHGSAVMWHEFDKAVLEFYPSPHTFTVDTHDEAGRVLNRIQHTVDYMVIQADPLLEDWREESQLLTLERKDRERYVKVGRYFRDENGCWHDRELELLCTGLGMRHVLRTGRDIPRQFLENMRYLDPYLDERTPLLASDTQQRFHNILFEGPVAYRSLLDEHKLSADVIMSAIAQEVVYVDLFATRLGDIDQLYLFRDEETEKAFRLLWDAADHANTAPLPLPGMGILKPGCRLRYGERDWEVLLSTTGKHAEYLFFSADGHQMSLPADEAESLYADQASPEERSALVEKTHARRISDMSRTQVAKATKKLNAVLSGARVDSASTTGRAIRVVRNAATLLDAFVALGGRDSDKGSRVPRLSPETEQPAKHEIETFYNGPDAPSASKTYRRYTVKCDEQGVVPMSFPTFLARVQRYGKPRIRGGARAGYDAADIPFYLDIREPIHGLFPYEVLYIDHTLVNIFVDGPNHEDWGKPWLTLGRDGHVPRVLAMYLDMRAPSQSAALMILRDYVRRWKRLPRLIIVDGGREFRVDAFALFCSTFGIKVRYRATNKPRGGAPIESLIGVTEDELISGLEGNSIQLKLPRQISPKELPNERRRWRFESLYQAFENYLFEARPNVVHARLGVTPLEYENIRFQETGKQEHLTISFDENLLLMTSRFPPRRWHKVQPHKGVWLTGDYYWHSDMSSLGGRILEVRVEDWCANVIYVNTGKEWLTAIKRVVEPYLGRQRYEVEQALRAKNRFNQLAAQRGKRTIEHARRMVASSDRLLFDEKIAQQRQIIGACYGALNMTMARPVPPELAVAPSAANVLRSSILPAPPTDTFEEAKPPELADKQSDDTWSEPDGRTGFL
ncbi:integrase catalytic domain-containing protein [Paraburkholderia sp. MM5477-R1]|uniref:integrase catalytic domain-containing protein n=1 Tax=Paraburkholderia sp. MM5477-R1 TaxID=2991062 RepID=UPI003D20316E